MFGLLYRTVRKVIKQHAVIIEAYCISQLRTKCFQHPAANVMYKCKGTYCGSLVWTSTLTINN